MTYKLAEKKEDKTGYYAIWAHIKAERCGRAEELGKIADELRKLRELVVSRSEKNVGLGDFRTRMGFAEQRLRLIAKERKAEVVK